MEDATYLGTGAKFPLQVNPATGRIETSSGTQSVKESIHIILSTARTERMARPGFGASLEQYVFMDVSFASLTLMERSIRDIILKQEPRIESLDIRTEPDLDNGRVIFYIEYGVAGDYTTDSLVYPFYINVDDQIENEDVNGEVIDEASQVEEVVDGGTE